MTTRFYAGAVFATSILISAGLGAGVAGAKSTRADSKVISGSASWYGGQFHGRKTANGERFNMHDLTAAHRSLPFGTKVRVTNQKNGKSVVVRINDRGPFVGKRVIDLSRGAAQAVSMVSSGVAPVKLQVLR
jgi:rare lipoprotein A